ncbi:MAG TPA: hypothetical protein VLK29_12645, partial [Luteimonas sp.]|nr:hypothetical protein [Luteimonas sp.]
PVPAAPVALDGLVDALQASQQQQGELGRALLHLASAIRAGLAARPEARRRPHTPTDEERRLDEALARLQAGLDGTPVPE